MDKQKKLRRSRAIKVKSERVSVVSVDISTEKEEHLNVADRIEEYNRLIKQTKDSEHAQAPVKDGHYIKTRRMLESKQNRSASVPIVTVDNILLRRIGKKEDLTEPVADCSQDDQQTQDLQRDKLSPNLHEKTKCPPLLPPKPKSKDSSKHKSDFPESLLSELTLKLHVGDKSDDQSDFKASSEETSPHRPLISPKPRMLSKGHSDSDRRAVHITEEIDQDAFLS